MTISMTWNYEKHDEYMEPIDGLAGVVKRVYFSITVSDGRKEYVHHSSRNLPLPVDPNTFVPEADLKGTMLLGWAKDDLGEAACALYEQDAIAAFAPTPEKTVVLKV
jgi:hypothetical protein